MNHSEQMLANSFGTTFIDIEQKGLTAEKTAIFMFRSGDIIACFAGFPKKKLAIIELTKDFPEADDVVNCITGRSSIPTTSHIISSNWFKL